MYARRRTDVSVVIALAIAQAVVVAVVIAIGAAATGGAPPLAYGFALASGAVVVAAARLPVAAVTTAVVLVIGYYIVDLPAIGVSVPIVGTVYLSALAGRVVIASAASAVLITLSAVFRAIEGGESNALLAYDTVTNCALIAATIALAALLRAREQTARQQLRIIELERAMLDRRLDDERLRISREIHDSLGHRLITVSVHAEIAAEAHGHADRSAALQRVQDGTRAALNELRAAVRSIRAGSDHAPLENIADAVEASSTVLEAAGFEVSSRVDPRARELSADLHVVAVRVVQEAVTNILKHSNAHRVELEVDRSDGEMLVRVHDDGGAVEFTPGAGIRGLRERLEERRGTLTVESGSAGFTVQARVPEGSAR